MFIIIEMILELIMAPRFMLCAVVGFILYYIIGFIFPGSDWADTVSVIFGLSFMSVGIIWELRSGALFK